MGKIILFYLIFVNMLSSAACIGDKIKAVKHHWRISEKSLWVLSLAGGSAGMYLTMLLIRHKTLHKSFMLGLPFLIIIQIIAIFLLTKYNIGHIMS
ncbi:MAG: DUF1294 domain-containing protein [Clostridia bacterium]|nr:DUF1294 domain-containing protein [Clostridia bacterium]